MSQLPILNPGNEPKNAGQTGQGGCGSSGGRGSCGGTSFPASLTSDDMSATGRLPKWLKRQIPKGNNVNHTASLLDELKLVTVCDSAKCPNRMECYSQQTATFMILGDVCTRPCGFCAVNRGRPEALEIDEPDRLAEAAFRLGLKHVVITSVTRDDLPDGGAEHFYQCIKAVREKCDATVEVLTPDFLNNPEALMRVVEAKPEVFNHNTETVPRLYRRVRGPKSDYKWTLEMLRLIKEADPQIKTKSGLPVVRYVPPEEFNALGTAAKHLGFKKVASGPFVRSSYHARDMAETDMEAELTATN